MNYESMCVDPCCMLVYEFKDLNRRRTAAWWTGPDVCTNIKGSDFAHPDRS